MLRGTLHLFPAGFFCGLVLCFSGYAKAQTRPADSAANLIRHSTSQQGTASAAGSTDLLRTLIALAIVIGAIVVLRWVLKKLSSRVAPASGSTVRIVSRTPISPRQSLVLLHIGRRVLLVAEAGQQITTLCEITDEDEIAELLNEPAPRRAQREDFATVLKRATPPPAQDIGLSTTQHELTGLIKKVRVLSQHFKRA